MKPKNFPTRRIKRQIDANRDRSSPYTIEELAKLGAARQRRTKKRRAS